MKKLLHTQRRGLALWLLTLMCLASVNVWGQETVYLEEDFSSITSGNNNTTGGSNYSWDGNDNFPQSTLVKVYKAGGAVKLGSKDNPGSMTTNNLDLSANNGIFYVTFDVKGWTSVEGKITISLNGTEKETVVYSATMDKDFETKTVEFSGGTSNSTITIATTSKRAFIDNVKIFTKASSTTQCSAPTFSPASGTSFANTLTVTASTATEGGKIVYTTDPEATLDANSTEFPSEGLTIDATTTIRAITVDPNGTLENSGEVSATYTKINLTKSVYKKITSTDEISAGATYVIINESNNIALGFIDEDGYGKIVNTYLQDGFARFDTENNNENPYEIVLSEGTDGNYILETVQGKIGYESSTSFAINKNTNWNISFTRDGNASITNIEGNREIRYNSNTNDFRLYTSNSGTLKVQLYKKVAFNITDAGFATYYTDKAFVMPENVQGGIVTKANNETSQLTVSYNYQPGTVVPAKTPIVLKGEKGDYTVNYTTSEETAPAGNMLYGAENVDADGMTFVEGTNVKYYKLALGNDGKCGFYWGATDGAAFEYTANRAFLAIDITDASQAPEGFSLDGDGGTTDIDGVMNGNDDSQKIYTVTGVYAGKSLDKLPKGIYIVGGKKVAVK